MTTDYLHAPSSLESARLPTDGRRRRGNSVCASAHGTTDRAGSHLLRHLLPCVDELATEEIDKRKHAVFPIVCMAGSGLQLAHPPTDSRRRWQPSLLANQIDCTGR